MKKNIAIFIDESSNSIDNYMQRNILHLIGKSLSIENNIIYIDSIKQGKGKASQKLNEQSYDILLTYNRAGHGLGGHSDNLFKKIERPHFIWLVEHPVTFYDLYHNSTNKNKFYITPNKTQQIFLRKMGLNPWGTNLLFASNEKKIKIDYARRKYDICIAAQWRGDPSTNEFWNKLPDEERKFFNDINTLQHLEENGDILIAFMAALESKGENNNALIKHAQTMKALYWHARKAERMKLIEDLVKSQLKILLIGGNEWSSITKGNSNIQIIPAVSHDELQSYYQNSRAILSTNCFNGANERTFDAMSSGAISISENSPSLNQHFTDGKNIIFYEHLHLQNKLPYIEEIIKSDAGTEIAQSGLIEFKKNHTWKNRASELNNKMDEIYFTHRNKNQTHITSRTIFPKQERTTSRAIIFAHYDQDGVVHDDTLDLIKKLKEYSNRIIFVSTNISKTYKEVVSQDTTIIERDNYGYDFWSYKIGLDQINTEEYTNILFLNNSFIVTNPKLFCEEYFSNLSNEEGLKGLTISHQISTHIQSFFIEFIGCSLINSNKFKDWWASMTPISEQKSVIQKYEIGMSQYFSSHGFKLKALFNPTKKEMLLASMRSITNYHFKIQNELSLNELTISPLWAEKLNPTSLLWFELFQKYHFIKVKTMNKTNLDFNPGIFNRYLSSLRDHSESHIIDVLRNRNINH